MFQRGRILIFARTPEMGAVKTRLQPVLGEQGCYQFHEMLVSHALQTVTDTRLAPVEVWHTGNPEHAFWQEKQKAFPMVLQQQTGGDLGVRMFDAISSHLGSTIELVGDREADGYRGAEGDRDAGDSKKTSVDWVILIGSDCPEIDKSYLAQAAELLETGEEIVLGPAEDGGYVLIGLRSAHAFLFQNIPWGSSSVLAETKARAKQNNCIIHCMPTRRDLDVAEDLLYYQAKIPWTNSVSPTEFISKA